MNRAEREGYKNIEKRERFKLNRDDVSALRHGIKSVIELLTWLVYIAVAITMVLYATFIRDTVLLLIERW